MVLLAHGRSWAFYWLHLRVCSCYDFVAFSWGVKGFTVMAILGIVLFGLSIFLIGWFKELEPLWDIMTIPARMLLFAAPIISWTATCFVWTSMLL
jgi:hypothetical protein